MAKKYKIEHKTVRRETWELITAGIGWVVIAVIFFAVTLFLFGGCTQPYSTDLHPGGKGRTYYRIETIEVGRGYRILRDKITDTLYFCSSSCIVMDQETGD